MSVPEPVWAHVVRASDRALFKRCRRQWDFAARSRQNLEPTVPLVAFDWWAAIRAALAVYYFPGMWEWGRQIVRPLVHKAFADSLRDQRAARERAVGLDAAEEAAWASALDAGSALLDDYFDWAPTVDDFTPVLVDTDFEIDVPHPTRPQQTLRAEDGRAIRFRGRVDVLVVDPGDVYWLVRHRLASQAWAAPDLLALDEAGVAACWAWEHFYLGMRVAGVIHNELRPDATSGLAADPGPPTREAVARTAQGHRRMYLMPSRLPDPRMTVTGTDRFRRTTVPVSRGERAEIAARVADEATEMTSRHVALYPHPTDDNCSTCAYRRPCIATNERADVAAVLAADYRPRPSDHEEGRLGGRSWSMNRGAAPPRFGRGRPGKEDPQRRGRDQGG